MATNTYVALDKVTISGSSTNQITFSSIPATYTDLVIVVNGSLTSGAQDLIVFFNNENSGSNYSATYLTGNGTGAFSTRYNNRANFPLSYSSGIGTTNGTFLIQVQNYANTNTFKTTLARVNNTSYGVEASSGLWRSTAAINRIDLICGGSGLTFLAGTTFSLYGIRAEGVSPAAKATGGDIYSDASYYYHVFDSTGTFTPLSSLSCEYLVVAGGGGGGTSNGGGGGGAGGYVYSSATLSATGYTATIGAGGSGAADGNNTTFNGSTALKGGKGGNSGAAGTGGSGTYGSGGGNGRDAGANGGGAGTSGQGFAGGGPSTGSNPNGGSGGGGAGSTGYPGKEDSAANNGGLGGTGTSTYSSWVIATGVGQVVSGTGYIAGGGGGAPANTVQALGGYGGGGQSATFVSGGAIKATSGQAGTGSGGGGGGNTGSWTSAPGNGGSGVVIVRYAK
jgi:hypothetical protein